MAGKKSEDISFDVVNVTVVSLLILMILYPLYWVLIASISEPNAVNSGNVLVWPVGFSLSGYQKLAATPSIWRAYRNTVVFAVVGTALNLFVTICGGYALSRPQLPFRGLIMKFLIFTMFFNGGLIPTYLLVKNLNLLNTMWAVLLPTTLSVYNMTVARAFFQSSVPDGIIEAANIDGCGNIRTFFSIVLPVSPAIVSVLVLFHVVFRWNEFFAAMIYITKPEGFPLQLVLREVLVSSQAAAQNLAGSGGDSKAIMEIQRQAQLIKYAAIVISTIPMMVIYPFMQKYFVKGIMVGALKG
ncbi:MAG: carbohydrate ABC transporter permease [Clostridiales bacterium]|jgi:putative aldouronate transport system permease protein|nr:carbohydrate ABC transporter permease [Clostridiales bacterium]